MNRFFRSVLVLWIAVVATLWFPTAQSQVPTAFHYHGHLMRDSVPYNGTIDLAFQPMLDGVAFGALHVEDDVEVNNGLFQVAIDLGNIFAIDGFVTFEVSVRDGDFGDAGTLGGYEVLSTAGYPVPVPYAARAMSVAGGSVTGVEVEDGTLDARDVNSTDTSWGIQRRLAAGCPAGSALSNISNTGQPSCQSVVSSVTASPGSGIVVQQSGGVVTLSAAAPGVGAQLPITGECPASPRASIRKINADGSVQCVYTDTATPAASVVLASAGNVGSHLSISRRSSTSSIDVAYYDTANGGTLRFVRCANEACASPAPTSVEIATGGVGEYVSLMHNSQNLPVMVYYDTAADDLQVASCANQDCTGGATIRTIDSTGDVGRFAEIVRYGSNYGVVYLDLSNQRYKYARCADPQCLGAPITPLADLPLVGAPTGAVAAARDLNDTSALPFFVVLTNATGQNADGRVQAVQCQDASCSTRTTQVVAQGQFGSQLATGTWEVGGARRRWITFSDQANNARKFVTCYDEACTQRSAAISLGGLLANGTAVVPRLEGAPIIVSSITDASFPLRVWSLSDIDSFATSSPITVPVSVTPTRLDAKRLSSGGVGIVYYDSAAQDLRYQRCQYSDCGEL